MKQLQPMKEALKECRAALVRGEIPVGCVITDARGVILARAHNETGDNPLHHAEILAIERALSSKTSKSRLDGCALYVTLEPCALCAAAISLVRVARLYFGAWDEKMGAVESNLHLFDQKTCHHKPEIVGGICERESAALLKEFFAQKR